MGTPVSVTGAYNKTEQDMKRRHLMAGLGALMVMGGCTPSSQVDNVAGQASVYEDPSSSGRVQGVGIESQDVVAMTDEMMRDMLSNRILAARDVPPRIIIDNEYFKNESSSIINTNLLTDRLRVELNRAANGRMVFVGRHFAGRSVVVGTAHEQDVVVSDIHFRPASINIGRHKCSRQVAHVKRSVGVRHATRHQDFLRSGGAVDDVAKLVV